MSEAPTPHVHTRAVDTLVALVGQERAQQAFQLGEQIKGEVGKFASAIGSELIAAGDKLDPSVDLEFLKSEASKARDFLVESGVAGDEGTPVEALIRELTEANHEGDDLAAENLALNTEVTSLKGRIQELETDLANAKQALADATKPAEDFTAPVAPADAPKAPSKDKAAASKPLA